MAGVQEQKVIDALRSGEETKAKQAYRELCESNEASHVAAPQPLSWYRSVYGS